MSESYKPRFDTGDLVVTPPGLIGIVEPSSQYRRFSDNLFFMHYVIRCWTDEGPHLAHLAGEVLRRPTFWEFLWFRNPNTGGWMFGKTRGWMAILIHVFGSIVIYCSTTVVQAWWNVLVAFIGIAPIAAVWIGVKRNLTKKWV